LSIFKDLKLLFCDNTMTTILNALAGICVVNNYILALCNAPKIKGNRLHVMILFSIAECLGILIGERLTKKVKDTKGIMRLCFTIITANGRIKFAPIP
jgi:hypothetical protein